MFYYEEFPIPEISDITGKPVGTIKSLLHTGAACSTRRDRPSKAQSQVNIYHVVDGAYLLKIAERAREGNDPVKALAYYDKFISEYPDNEKIPDALYWPASILPDDRSFIAVIFPCSMWQRPMLKASASQINSPKLPANSGGKQQVKNRIAHRRSSTYSPMFTSVSSATALHFAFSTK